MDELERVSNYCFIVIITNVLYFLFLAGYATLPRPVSNGPSPEELEQQRRYLEDFLLNAVRLFHFASCNPPLVAFYCCSAYISSGLGSADNSDYIAIFQLGRI